MRSRPLSALSQKKVKCWVGLVVLHYVVWISHQFICFSTPHHTSPHRTAQIREADRAEKRRFSVRWRLSSGRRRCRHRLQRWVGRCRAQPRLWFRRRRRRCRGKCRQQQHRACDHASRRHRQTVHQLSGVFTGLQIPNALGHLW
jgi:hypothetical protein